MASPYFIPNRAPQRYFPIDLVLGWDAFWGVLSERLQRRIIAIKVLRHFNVLPQETIGFWRILRQLLQRNPQKLERGTIGFGYLGMWLILDTSGKTEQA